ncbi:MAG: hypothetical protein HYV95_17580 [Opitutae bacterium]|nr:hypothetical protein [Opitutae bacterium]
MNTALLILGHVLTALIAGVLGGAAMEGVLLAVGGASGRRVDMILALGSLITRTRENAYRVGLVIHAISAVGFALVYTMALVALGYTRLPNSMMLGLGFGVLHGLVVSLMIVWIVADQHPLEEFKEADLAIGLSHLAGHAAYGLVVGLVVGLSPGV